MIKVKKKSKMKQIILIFIFFHLVKFIFWYGNSKTALNQMRNWKMEDVVTHHSSTKTQMRLNKFQSDFLLNSPKAIDFFPEGKKRTFHLLLYIIYFDIYDVRVLFVHPSKLKLKLLLKLSWGRGRKEEVLMNHGHPYEKKTQLNLIRPKPWPFSLIFVIKLQLNIKTIKILNDIWCYCKRRLQNFQKNWPTHLYIRNWKLDFSMKKKHGWVLRCK